MKPLIRQPNWRLELAEEYVDEVDGDFSSVKFEKKEDALIQELVKYLCKAKDAKLPRRKLRAEFPYIHEAYTLNSDCRPFSDRWLIEAAVVAGVPSSKIAEYLCIQDDKFIDTFCQCFFDLRDKSIKGRYIKNIQAFCVDKKRIIIQDVGWKVIAANYGWKDVEAIFLNRQFLGAVQYELLRDRNG